MTTVDYTLLANNGPITIQAQPVTPGLYIYEAPDTIDEGAPCRWRLGHHSGRPVARFSTAEDARDAAVSLIDWVDWTGDSAVIAANITARPDLTEFLHLLDDARGHVGNCSHPAPETTWLPNGGHTGPMCAYVAGISSRCTCT
jgi:hypothetical protein